METLLDNQVNEFELSDGSGKSVSVKDISLPYILKGCTLFSPGRHNGILYTENVIKKGFSNTQWNERTSSLYHAHKDEFAFNPNTGKRDLHVGAEIDDYAGYVTNLKYLDGGVIKGDLNITDLNTAIKVMLGAKVGVSPRGTGYHSEKGDRIEDMIIENWSLTVNPAIKTTYVNKDSNNRFLMDHFAFAMSELPLTNLMGVNSLSDRDKNIEVKNMPDGVAAKTAEEQLKELQDKYDSMLTEVDALKKQVKEYPLPKNDGMNGGKGEDELKRLEEELKKKLEEEMKKYKHPAEDTGKETIDEDMMDFLNSMTPVELASWKELVKKYGIPEAKKLYKKEKEDQKLNEQNAEIKSLKSELTELKDRFTEKLIPEVSMVMADGKSFNLTEINDDQLNQGMLNYFRMIAGGNV